MDQDGWSSRVDSKASRLRSEFFSSRIFGSAHAYNETAFLDGTLSIMSSARHANRQTRSSIRERTDYTSSLATAADLDVQYKPSSLVSQPRLESERECRLEELFSFGCIAYLLLLGVQYTKKRAHISMTLRSAEPGRKHSSSSGRVDWRRYRTERRETSHIL